MELIKNSAHNISLFVYSGCVIPLIAQAHRDDVTWLKTHTITHQIPSKVVIKR